jgi:hypothetical protein
LRAPAPKGGGAEPQSAYPARKERAVGNALDPPRTRNWAKPPKSDEAEVDATGPVKQAKRLMADLAVRALQEGRTRDGKQE